jgi:hypothetical protein
MACFGVLKVLFSDGWKYNGFGFLKVKYPLMVYKRQG